MKIYKNTEDLSLGERIKYLKRKQLVAEDVTAALQFAVLLAPIMNVDFLYQAFQI